MIDIPPQISFVFFAVWLLLFLAGRYQFNKIKQFTTDLVENNVLPAINRNPKLTVDEYYDQIYQEWVNNISSKYYFIPHKTELFPVRLNPLNVVKRINFTPEWVGAYLQLKGYHLECTKAQGVKIDEILATAPRVARNMK